MYTKKNTRVTFRSNRRPNFKRNNNFSNNKPRNKGNVTQQYNKYIKLAKEAFSSGDRVQSEYYYQFTDHYFRLMTELGITLEENDTNEEKMISQESNDSNESDAENQHNNEKKDINKEDDEIPLSNEVDDENIESIESIPFISKPPKKKTSRVKKASA